jgi:hypothetical protein
MMSLIGSANMVRIYAHDMTGTYCNVSHFVFRHKFSLTSCVFSNWRKATVCWSSDISRFNCEIMLTSGSLGDKRP